MADDEHEASSPETGDDHVHNQGTREKLLSRLTRRLQNPRELGGDAMDLLGTMLETSDRARTEMMRLVAREVRMYLEELKLKEAIGELVTGHSLDIHVNVALKPLDPRAPREAEAHQAASAKPDSKAASAEPEDKA